MKVAIFGGTGFVGSYLVDNLIRQRHQPVLLVRPGSEAKVQHRDECTIVSGDVRDAEPVQRTVEGCDAVIYNVGILREFRNKGITFEELHVEAARRTMDAAVTADVSRFLLMSANGVKPDGTAYQSTKYRAEEYLQQTELEWTIFRPSVIFGDPRGRIEFATQLRAEIIDSPFPAPLFYDTVLPLNPGSFQMSPVHVENVAEIFVKSLAMSETVHNNYVLCGPQAFTWKEIIQLLARSVGQRKLAVPVPTFALKPAAMLLEQFEFFPLTQDQLTMLLEGNTGDSTDVVALFNVDPIFFNQETLGYLNPPQPRIP